MVGRSSNGRSAGLAASEEGGYGAAVTAFVPELASQELDAGSDFVVAEWTAQPSSSGEREPVAPIHVHRSDDEAWYVLDGELGFSFDGVEFSVSAGGAALARSGVAHTYWNAAPTATRYLIIMTPRLRELIAVLHDPRRRQGRSVAEVFAAYDSVLVSDG